MVVPDELPPPFDELPELVAPPEEAPVDAPLDAPLEAAAEAAPPDELSDEPPVELEAPP